MSYPDVTGSTYHLVLFLIKLKVLSLDDGAHTIVHTHDFISRWCSR